ncbi:hypothetical protein IJL65_04815 [bacterium]|nr:hypothetical protein [bacterium]
MDTTKNNISPQAMLSAVAGLMFFAPFIKRSVSTNPSLPQDEKDFVM